MIGGVDIVVSGENLKKLQHRLASLQAVSFSITHTLVDSAEKLQHLIVNLCSA